MVTETAALDAGGEGMFPVRRDAGKQGFQPLSDTLGTLYVAVTVVIMAYSSLFTVVPILVFLLLWLSHAWYKGSFTLRLSPAAVAVLSFPLLCCYSTFWSDYPARTLYQGMELLTLVLCAIIMSRVVRPRPFIQGLCFGAMIVLGMTLASGNYSKDYLSGTYSLVGLFGSKNQVGFVAEIAIYAGLLGLFFRGRWLNKLFFSVLPLGAAFACIVLSNSATSIASLAILAAFTLIIFGVTLFPARYRTGVAAFLGLSLVAFGTLIAAAHLDITTAALDVLGKSPTLTGRTYLWSEGFKNGLLHPVLGCGYSAFWVPGQVKAEQYWHEFYISGESGFHFHNLFVQTFVDLGAVGVILLSSLLLVSCAKSLRAVLRGGFSLESGITFGLSFMFLIRACFEVDALGPYGIGPLLFFSLLPMQEAARQPPKEYGSKRNQVSPRTLNQLEYR